MLPDRLTQLAGLLSAPVSGDADVCGIAIDSRRVQPGDLFVALKAERDGHAFIDAAREAGAVAALVSEPVGQLPSIQVVDTGKALTELAAHFRNAYTHPVVALTGSQGKTSTRGFIGSVLAQTAAREGREILVTHGNLNNQLGVPLTAARLRADHAFAVFELGASAVGDIAHLAAIVRPHVSALLNARAAHLEGFGSIAGVVEGKGEIIDHTDPEGVVILNGDEPAFPIWRERAGSRTVRTFGRHAADVQWRPLSDQDMTLTLDGTAITLRLPTLGHHFMENAAAAAAVCLAAGASQEDLVKGLESAVIEPGRMTPIALDGLRLIDDTYNASPDAVRAAIDWLSDQSGQRMLVLGHLAELGSGANQTMRELGDYAKQKGIDQLIAVGDGLPFAEGYDEGALYFHDMAELTAAITSLVTETDTVLVKGSRSARMDQVVSTLADTLGRM